MEGSEDVSTIELLRRILVGLLRAIEEGAELISASLREDLVRFRVQLERRVLGFFLVLAGAGLATAGIVLFLQELIESWPLVLLLSGGVYLAGGMWFLFFRHRPGGDNE